MPSGGYCVVETRGGKLRGRVIDGIHTFKGIPYAASTAGTNRFKPPAPLKPWAGLRDAFELTAQCPQPTDTNFSGADPAFERFIEGAFEPSPGRFSEDCLALNVWTAALDSGRRPVMVWLHGGGFEMGSGGAPWSDGAALCRTGDVVVVTLNHRLNVLGYLHLSELAGQEFAAAGNAGMLDIVAALQWVRDNIEMFGGDPGNVTIFGCSGGGTKVNTLLAMPCAAGLFHKAIVQSSYTLRLLRSDEATHVAERVLAALGLDVRPGNMGMERLASISVEQLLAAMATVKAEAAVAPDLSVFARVGFAPVVDGNFLPRQAFDAEIDAEMDAQKDAQGISTLRDVPMIVGSNADETTMLLGGADPSLFTLDETRMRAGVEKFTGLGAGDARRLVEIYRRHDPGASPAEVYFSATSDHMFRMDAIRQSEWQARRGGAPVYMYLFTWKAPAMGGRYKAAHGIDVPLVFGNADRAQGFGGSGEERGALADKVSQAWVSFARSGHPGHVGPPESLEWQPYTLDSRATMIFDTTCRVAFDPGAEVRRFYEQRQGRSGQ